MVGASSIVTAKTIAFEIILGLSDHLSNIVYLGRLQR